MNTPFWLDHVLVALLSGVGLYAVLFGQAKLKQLPDDAGTRIATYWSNAIALWVGGILTCVVWWMGDRSLATLGITWNHDSLGLGLLITLGFIVALGIATWWEIGNPDRRARLRARMREEIRILPETPRETRHFAFLGVAAGVNEEIIARGFLILYFIGLFGDSTAATIAAVAIPAVAFGLAHLYQGWRGALPIMALAGAFGAIFVVTGSLLIPIILHIAIDVGFGWLWLRRGAAQSPGELITEPAA